MSRLIFNKRADVDAGADAGVVISNGESGTEAFELGKPDVALSDATAGSVLEHYDLNGLRRVAEGRNIHLPDFLLRHQVIAALKPLLFAEGSLLSALSRLSGAEWNALYILAQCGPLNAYAALERIGQHGVSRPAGVLLGLVSSGLVIVVPQAFASGEGGQAGKAGKTGKAGKADDIGDPGSEQYVRLEGKGDELLFVPEQIVTFLQAANKRGSRSGMADFVLPGVHLGNASEEPELEEQKFAGIEINLAGAFGRFVRSLLALLHRVRGGDQGAIAREILGERTAARGGSLAAAVASARAAVADYAGMVSGGGADMAAVTGGATTVVNPGGQGDSLAGSALGVGLMLVILQSLGIVIDRSAGQDGGDTIGTDIFSSGGGNEYTCGGTCHADHQVSLENAAAFASLPKADQVRSLYKAWKSHCEPPTVLELDNIRLVPGGEESLTPENYLLRLARDRVAEALVFCSAAKWTSVAVFVDFLLARNPDFIYPFPGGWGEPYYPGIEWGKASSTSFRKIRRAPDHRPVEDLFIRTILSQLESLGLVVMSRTRQEFRPSAEGLYALGFGRKPDEKSACGNAGEAKLGRDRVRGGGGFIVQPTFEVLVFPERASIASLFTIGRFAAAGASEPAPTYLITRDSVYEGICGGLKAADIVTFLESGSDFALPQNVRFSVLDWGKSFDRFQFLPECTVIDFDNVHEAEDVLRHGSGLPEDAFWAGPARLVLPLTDRRDIARVLGQNPSAEMDYGINDGLPPCLVVNGDLTVTVQMDRLNFKVEQLLNRIGTDGGEGVWRITPQSLRESRIKWGLDSAAIRAALLDATTGRLPPELDIALDASMAAEPGKVSMDRPLVVFTDAAWQLDAMYASEVISRYLMARVGPCCALIVEQGADKFREHLQRLGVGVGVGVGDMVDSAGAGAGEKMFAGRILEQGDGAESKGGVDPCVSAVDGGGNGRSFGVARETGSGGDALCGETGSDSTVMTKGHSFPPIASGKTPDRSQGNRRSAVATVVEVSSDSDGKSGKDTDSGSRMGVKHLVRFLNQAVDENRDVIILYDPGSRKPLESLKVSPISLEDGRSATYLSAVSVASGEARKFSLNFIHSVDYADYGERR